MHQSFFSPPIQTIAKAANNNQLQGIPCLNSPKIVQKYLVPSPATSKGGLKKQRANVRTTRPKIKVEDTVPIEDEFKAPSPTSIPNATDIRDSHSASNVLCCAALGDATTGTFYTNITGAFLVRMIMILILCLLSRARTSTMVQSSQRSKKY